MTIFFSISHRTSHLWLKVLWKKYLTVNIDLVIVTLMCCYFFNVKIVLIGEAIHMLSTYFDYNSLHKNIDVCVLSVFFSMVYVFFFICSKTFWSHHYSGIQVLYVSIQKFLKHENMYNIIVFYTLRLASNLYSITFFYTSF